MHVIEYTPERFDLVRRAGEQAGVPSLSHRPFVDHYYAGNPWCRLYLAMTDDSTVGALCGVEILPFEYRGRPVRLGYATNFHSLSPGAGGVLFMRWIKSCDIGVAFGGTADTHRILRQQRWTYFKGIHTYLLNPRLQASLGESWLRRGAYRFLELLSRRPSLAWRSRKIARAAGPEIAVEEEAEYPPDLVTAGSGHAFRLSPSIEYLRWRYNPNLTFVRYRPFRIRVSGRTAGYVILNDGRDRLIVSACDGENAQILAFGCLLALARVASEGRARREVVVVASDPALQRIYRRFGFITSGRWDRPFALGLRAESLIKENDDVSQWLINYDIGDNGMRVPFLDQ